MDSGLGCNLRLPLCFTYTEPSWLQSAFVMIGRVPITFAPCLMFRMFSCHLQEEEGQQHQRP